MTYVGTIVGFDTAQGNAQNATSLSWTDVITNTPSGATNIQAGDLAFIFWTHTQGSAEATIPSGFTQIKTQDDNTLTYSVYQRTMAGGETGAIGTIGAGAIQRQTWILVVVRGYSGVDAITSVADAGTDANHTTPAATPTVADVGVLIGDGTKQGTGPTSTTPPAGYTVAAQTSTDATSRNFGAVAYEGSSGNISGTHTAGVAINPGTFVDNASGADNATMTLLLTPASVAATGTAALTVSAAGVALGPGVATASLTLTASGTPQAVATSSAALSLSATGTASSGTSAATGTASLSLSATGNAAAKTGAGSGFGEGGFGEGGFGGDPASGGFLTITGTATPAATSNTSGSLTLSGSGGARAAATGTASLSLSGTGSSTAPATGTASLTLNGAGASAGEMAATGTASLSLNASAGATATPSGTASLSLAGSSTAQAAATGNASLSFTGNAGGAVPVTGAATLTLAGTTALSAAATGQALLTLQAVGEASGRPFVDVELEAVLNPRGWTAHLEDPAWDAVLNPRRTRANLETVSGYAAELSRRWKAHL